MADLTMAAQLRGAGRAAAWVAVFAPLWGIGTFIASLFPIFTEPFTTPDRPIRWLILAACLTWGVQLVCESVLGSVMGDEYPPWGPFARILGERAEPKESTRRERSGTLTNGGLYIFLMSALPLTLILSTTTVAAWAWVATMGTIALAHIRITTRRYLEWQANEESSERETP